MYELMRLEYILPDKSDTPKILLWGRNENRELRLFGVDFTPHLYIPKDMDMPANLLERYVKKIYGEYKTINDELVKRVDIKCSNMERLTSIMKKLREPFGENTCESRILLTRRAIINLGIYGYFDVKDGVIVPIENGVPILPRINYLDIEIIPAPEDEVSVDEAIYSIVCLSFYDNYARKIIAMVWHPSFKSEIEVKNIDIKTKYGVDKFEVMVYRFNSERNLLNSFIDYVGETDPDLIAGWYSSGYFDKTLHKWAQGFDIPYIINRLQKLGINKNRLSPLNQAYITYDKRSVIKGRVLFDLLEPYRFNQKTIAELESWKLSFVVNYELGLKGLVPEKKAFIKEMWEKKPIELLQLNVLDVVGIVLLDKYKEIISRWGEIRKIMGVYWDDVLLSSRLVHTLALRLSKDKYILPDKLTKEDIYGKFVGAYVKEPPIGTKQWVIEFDFRTIYPDILRHFNISPETLDENGEIKVECALRLKKTNKVVIKQVAFKKEPKGLFPMIVEHLIKERFASKKRLREAKNEEERNLLYIQDRAYKFLLNSVFGVLGSKFYSLYNPFCSACVASIAREFVKYAEKILEEMGYTVIYADTDGLYVLSGTSNLKDCVNKAKELYPILLAKINEFVKNKWGIDKRFELGEPAGMESIFFKPIRGKERRGAKKSFGARIVWEDGKYNRRTLIKGLETKKSDSSPLSKKAQRVLLDMALDAKSREELIAYSKQVVKDYPNSSLMDMGVPKGIKSPLSSYARPPAVVRGTIYSNRWFHTDIKSGSKPRYLYVYGVEGYPPTDVIAFEELSMIPVDKVRVNYDKMLEASVRHKMECVLDALGINWEKEGLPIYKPKRSVKIWKAIKDFKQRQLLLSDFRKT